MMSFMGLKNDLLKLGTKKLTFGKSNGTII
jgi:hypothetical protein